LTPTGASSSVSVTAGDLHHFDFNTIGNQELSTPFSITITAKDASGNTVTDYTGTGNLTATFGLISVNISPASTGNFEAGVWTGDVTIGLIGTDIIITIKGSDDSQKTGTSNPFDVVVAT